MLKTLTSPVTLTQLLDAKEQRAKLQEAFRIQYDSVVLSMTLIMPGPVKYRPEWVGMLYEAQSQLRKRCFGEGMIILEERIIHSNTGATGLMAVIGSAERVKTLAIQLEEELAFGRLLDLDVFDASGIQINRLLLGHPARRCLVCGEIAAVCVRSQAHSSEDVYNAAVLLADLFLQTLNETDEMPGKQARLKSGIDGAAHTSYPEVVQKIGKTALEAMLMEVACTPAPGLVDRMNTGAHYDMDLMTFIRSSSAISDAMVNFALAGHYHAGTPAQLLPALRAIGKKAEQDMFQATSGVNTQKGVLFLLGILTASAAMALRNNPDAFDSSHVMNLAAETCQGLVERELGSLRETLPERRLTAGERYYLSHGLTGIRGEIERGLPVIREIGLPMLRKTLRAGVSDNDALVQTLLGLMTKTEDTTILNRHNLETLHTVQSDAAHILAEGGFLTDEGRKRVHALDDDYILRGISPGGSADLLAVTWFLYRLEEVFNQTTTMI